MRTFFAALILVALFPMHALGGGGSAVLYLDGALLEHEAVARKGYLEARLPAEMIPNSLRVRPVGDCRVLRVEISPALGEQRRSGELASLKQRRIALSDRLSSLRAKEEIFRAAARSQSGRAPRKTKTNPDPVEAVRKGTDFALSRLESTGVAVRKTERELADLDAKISEHGEKDAQASVARIWLSRDNGSAMIAFLVTGTGWTPSYDFRLPGNGFAEVSLRAGLPSPPWKGSLSVVPLTIAEAGPAAPAPVKVSSELSLIASYRFPLTSEELVAGPVPVLSFTFANSSGGNLPPGEASGYWRGAYIGASRFDACRAGGTRSLVFGR